MKNTKTLKAKIHTSKLKTLSYFLNRGWDGKIVATGNYAFVEVEIPITDSVLETVILE